jgi:HSP20 family protein
MKKIYIIFLFFLSGSVLAHSSTHNNINNGFESMMKHMFNQMKTMDMHHKHLFKRTGKKNNEKGWRSVTQSDDENIIKLTITLKGIDKEDLDIHIKKNVLVIRAEKEISAESSHSKQSFMQQFLIPKNTDRSGITAEFEDGVLIVTIPKPTKDNHDIQQITIQ